MTFKRTKLLSSLLALIMLFASVGSVSAFEIFSANDAPMMDHSNHQNMTMSTDSETNLKSCCPSCDLTGVCDSYSCHIASVAILNNFDFHTVQLAQQTYALNYPKIIPSSPELLFKPPKTFI